MFLCAPLHTHAHTCQLLARNASGGCQFVHRTTPLFTLNEKAPSYCPIGTAFEVDDKERSEE
eukprot:1933839-Rhodomonas_salina.1